MSVDQTELDQAEPEKTEGEATEADAAAEGGEGGGNGGEEPPGPPELEAGPPPPDPVRDRLLLPLLLPILAIAAVVFYALNISRVFLAGGNGAASVIVAGIVTVGILVGAAWISASPRMRSSTLTTTLALLFVVLMGAGLVTLGPSEPHGEGGEGGFQEPAGAPTATLAVPAGPGTSFGQDQFTTPGGILEINLVDEGEGHTLVFEGQEFAGFKLAVPEGKSSGKVQIGEGEYTIYCDIPGHRSSGMEAVVTVTPAPPGAAPAPGGEGGEGAPPASEAP